MRLKIKRSELLFIIAVAICSINKFNGVQVSIYLQNIVAALWILYSLTLRRKKSYKQIAKFNLKLAVSPVLLMMIYTSLLWLMKPPTGSGTTIEYFTRMFSTNTYLVFQFLFAYTAFSCFGEKVVNLIWNGMVINYVLISIIPAMIFCNLSDILSYLRGANVITKANYYLETHDITFAFGIFFIYYFVIEFRRRSKANLQKLIISTIFIYVGYKRIELLAIFLVLIYYYLIDVHFKNIKRKTAVIAAIVLATSYVFLWMIYSGTINVLAAGLHIEFNYRLDTWTYWAKRSSFGIDFPGLGLNFIDKDTYLMHQVSGLLQNGYVVLSGMHSDLYKKYVELGFIPFSLWIVYIVYVRTMRQRKQYGKWMADVYLLVTLYIVILYLTDNVYNYFITNVCYMIAPMAIALKGELIQEVEWKFKKSAVTLEPSSNT